jgi:flagellar biosynthesis protein FlhA
LAGVAAPPTLRLTPQLMLSWLARGDVAMALGVMGIVLLLVLPIAAPLIDVLLSLSLMSAVLILMTALLIRKPLEFTAFPTVLLVATLYRLGLNIASTRLILTHGHEGGDPAGMIIQGFGQLMMGGNYVIGVVVFIILVIVNFVVITKGSSRIAEVAARFTLDSMPGKQMAIDADLSSGLIDDKEAKRRRKELEQESQFFGAMDGASKFVRGDAMAGIIITFINVIGGMLIGVVQHHVSFQTAASSYTVLSIGEGLVSQVPALVISIAAGLLVSKSGVEGSADKALTVQLARNPVSMGVVSGSAGILGLIPGMPILPFAVIAVGAGVIAWRAATVKPPPEPVEVKPAEDTEEPISTALAMDDVKIELGYGLLGLINDVDGRKLTDQIRALRRTLASEYGFVMPSVRILDNMRLPTEGYSIRIREMEAGSGEVKVGAIMAMDPRGQQVDLPGQHVREPAFGLPATWIDETLREEATFRGYTIVDPATVLTTHLTEILKDSMPELLSYAEVAKLLRDLPAEQKKLADDLVPSQVSASTVQRVLQALLKERVSIRDLPTILEGIGEVATQNSGLTSIVEHVRARLAKQLCWQNRSDDGAVPIITLTPDWEQAFAEAIVGQGEDRQLALAPSRLQAFIQSVRDAFDAAAQQGETPVLLTSAGIRPYVRSIIERVRNHTTVLSQNEIHPRARLKTLGQI